jgi:hypothetical protein
MRLSHAVLALALGMTGGCSPHTSGRSASEEWEFADALPAYAPGSCVQPDSRERSLFDLAASAIEQGEDHPNWLEIGAQKFLARPQFRSDSPRHVAVCMPEDVLRRVADALASRRGFEGGLVEYQLELAFRLPTRSPYIVEAIGKSAFDPNIQPSDTFGRRDIRPFARTVLASFGEESKAFRNIAYGQMSINNSLGTGAAQVAAATGHPYALQRIEQMMEEALSAVPADKPIGRSKKNRLYELSWALAFSGAEGRKHTRPIHKMMQRNVESWAPPFGMLSLQPKSLCAILERIEGKDSTKASEFCADEKVPFDH